MTHLFRLVLLGLGSGGGFDKSLWGLVWLSNSKTDKTNLVNSLQQTEREVTSLLAVLFMALSKVVTQRLVTTFLYNAQVNWNHCLRNSSYLR